MARKIRSVAELFTLELMMRMGSETKSPNAFLACFQLPAIAKKQDALHPSGTDEQVCKRDRNARLASSCGLDDKHFAVACENLSQTRLIASI